MRRYVTGEIKDFFNMAFHFVRFARVYILGQTLNWD